MDILKLIADEQAADRATARRQLLELLQSSATWTEREIHQALDLASKSELDPNGKHKEWVAIFVQAMELERQAGQTIETWESTAPEREKAKATLDAAEKRKAEQDALLDQAVDAAKKTYHGTLALLEQVRSAMTLRDTVHALFAPLFGAGEWPAATSIYSFPYALQAKLRQAGLMDQKGMISTLRNPQLAAAEAERRQRQQEAQTQADIQQRNAEAAREREHQGMELVPSSTGTPPRRRRG